MRYTQPDALRALLFYDPTLGGRPIRLLRARWLLDYFDGDPARKLLSRQQLEREYPEAFADDLMLERLLKELGDTNARRGLFEVDNRAGMLFPGLVSCSYCWVDREHPDPRAETMRQLWLPAFEWYLSERVLALRSVRHRLRKRAENVSRMRDRLAKPPEGLSAEDLAVRRADLLEHIEKAEAHRAKATTRAQAAGAAGTDDELLSHADFALFVDFASICQHAGNVDGTRSPVEERLFKHALSSLDVIYAHVGMVSFLTTQLPRGCSGLGYDERGWCVLLSLHLRPQTHGLYV